jgi:hypothetical protein
MQENNYVIATNEGVYFAFMKNKGTKYIFAKTNESYLVDKLISSVYEYMHNKVLACAYEEHAIYCINRSTKETIK